MNVIHKALAAAKIVAPVFLQQGWEWATDRGYAVPIEEEIAAELLYQANHLMETNGKWISSGRLKTTFDGDIQFYLELDTGGD